MGFCLTFWANIVTVINIDFDVEVATGILTLQFGYVTPLTSAVRAPLEPISKILR